MTYHHEIKQKSISLLFISFLINMLLSVVEFSCGVFSGSVALIGDALHNTSDAFSILIATIAFKIGGKKADIKFTYGFKRAEIIGSFVNLILLFISGLYLIVEGIGRLIQPEHIDGNMIIWVSILALIVDIGTAKISHNDSHHNHNMKMVFVHNLADAFGSVGVIISGIFVLLFNIYWLDGIIAFLIASYMIFQSCVSFVPIVNILMNAAPKDLDIEGIRQTILSIKGVKDVHHLHLWMIDEHEISLECHVKSSNKNILKSIVECIKDKHRINHCNIQIEEEECYGQCYL